MISLLVYCLMLGASGADLVQTLHGIIRNVQADILISVEPYSTSVSPTLSICNMQCTSNARCESAIFDQKSNQCYIFLSSLDITTAGGESSDLSYIERCDWLAHPNPEENCCYVESLACSRFRPGDKVYRDCQDAFDQGERDSGGIYFLKPDTNWKTLRAVCQFDSGSGWTVIQRRLDGSVDFYRGWANYANGFGNIYGEYWIGLEGIFFLTRTNRKLSVYLEDHDGEVRTANYSSFYIDSVRKNYANHISGYTGDAGDSWSTRIDGKSFTTFDRDNDNFDGNCAAECSSGWWYRLCCYTNLNGIWYPGGTDVSYSHNAQWFDFRGVDYSYKTIYMRLGR